MTVLSIEDLTVLRGNRTVVRSLSMKIPAGEVTALLGANGAGKSSLVLALAGRLRLAAGRVVLNGTNLAGLAPNKIRRAGLAAVPEGHQVLAGLTVLDNLRAATLDPDREQVLINEVCELFPEFNNRLDQRAGLMSGGQQQMLAIAQALVSEPKFLLVDELSLGLAPVIVARLAPVMSEIAQRGVGVLLIEQFATVALDTAQRAAVMDRGEIVWTGQSQELAANPALLRGVYLGGSTGPTL